MRSLALLALCAALAAAGCSNRPEVRHDSDPTVTLSDYKTFGFFEPASHGGYEGLLGRRLKEATTQRLGRHYTHAERNPDLRVHLYLAVVERQEVRSVPATGPYTARRWGSGVETSQYRRGTLRIDLVDAKRQRLVWRGVAEGRLDARAMENPGPAIDEAVQEIFAGFPGPAVAMQ